MCLRVCKKCKIGKEENCFSERMAKCKDCEPGNQKVATSCTECGKVYMVRAGALKFKGRSGKCFECGMADRSKRISEEKVSLKYRECNICGEVKDAQLDFYVSNSRACCKSCMPQNQKIEHTCVVCGKKRIVTKANLRLSGGSCRSCATKEVSSRPEIKERASKNAKDQVLKQGGVPNAKKFTKEQGGENHYNWKGGITPENIRIRLSEDMKNWRRYVFERDNYTCQECGQRGGKLCAHHLKEFSNYPELRFELSNGQTLCYPCHGKTHNYGEKAKKKAA